MDRYDTIIDAALVVDGSGASGYTADVGVTSELITGIGNLSECEAVHRIDGSGLVLSPGFIDTHTHDDVALVRTPDVPFKVSQGVTTVITGNCGVSVAPLRPMDDMPAPYPLLGDDEYFPTVARYRARLVENPPAVNVAMLAGHSSLRINSMGPALDRSAPVDAIARMSESLDRALDEGCIGLSSGLAYPPATCAPTEELVTLASVLQRHPGAVYATHIRDEADGVVEAVGEALETGRRSGSAVVISHHKCAGSRNFGRSVETLRMIREAQAGQEVALDVYPYTASASSLLTKFVRDADAVVVTWSDSHPERAGAMLSDICADWECPTAEAVARLSPASAIYFQIDDEDLERILCFPTTMIGSDGIPGRSRSHPRLWGTFPRVLGRYVRDKRLLSLSEAVHKMTGLPAHTFGLHGRGLVREGYAADLTLFDPNTIEDRATYDEPEAAATGISRVLVNGALTWSEAAGTGVRAGRVLTHPAR